MADALERDIRSGKLKTGDRLSTNRELAQNMGVNFSASIPGGNTLYQVGNPGLTAVCGQFGFRRNNVLYHKALFSLPV